MLTEEMLADPISYKIEETPENVMLDMKTTLLKPSEKKTFGNRLIEDIKYEKAGSSTVFESLPKIVKISGFELNKKTTVKINVINKSKFCQRLIILPPTTPFFKIKFTKRGSVPPGLSEAIYLAFTPQSYQYYYDFIRIVSEGDKMIIPIHAYPKMNLHANEYVPRFFELGTVQIDTTASKELILKNIIDVPFEYEFLPVNQVEEISIIPNAGDIEALSNKTVMVTFKPKSYGFFRAEYEFHLSEFDFQPFTVVISGSCNTFGMKHLKKMRDNVEENQPLDSALKNSKINDIEVFENYINRKK